MKTLIFIMVSALSWGAMAQDYLSCNLKIIDNKTKRNAKELRESELTLNIELTAGLNYKKEIQIDRVLAYPGQSKTDKYLIRLFAQDKRDEIVSREKEIPMTRMDDVETISLQVYDSGFGTTAHFSTDAARYNLNIQGQGTSGKLNFLLYTKFSYLKDEKVVSKLSPIAISCQKVPKEIISESEIQKGEVSNIERERQIHQEAKASSSQQ